MAPQCFVRIRPLAQEGGHAENPNGDAGEGGTKFGGYTDDTVNIEDRHGETSYGFPTRVMGPDVTNEEMFETVGRPLVEQFMAPGGYDTLLFAVGGLGDQHEAYPSCTT